MKVFIYLNDIGESNGQFSFVPNSHPFSRDAGKVLKHKDLKRISDEEMLATFPQDRWRVCTGPATRQ